MCRKASTIIFIIIFFSMLVIPLLTTNLKKDIISESENRSLAPMAEIYNDDGEINKDFNRDFESWINDNIGFRSEMVIENEKIQYYAFNLLSDNSDMYLGPKGELNYATSDMLLDYQHKNLYSDEYLHNFAESMQCLSDYVEKKGKQFYYFQCWDKHSIYPEYFPDTVIQYGSESKTDGIVRSLDEYSQVKVISPKEQLIKEKSTYDTYSKWGDPTHWSQRGAYIGYKQLINKINEDSEQKFKLLSESDYNITLTDQGSTLYGGIHKADNLENFEIKNPEAAITNNKLKIYADDPRHIFYTNEKANNKTRLLILGDSYFCDYIVDDLAESFYETVLIWGDYGDDFKTIIDSVDPDIVVVENAERCDRSSVYIIGANKIKDSLQSE